VIVYQNYTFNVRLSHLKPENYLNRSQSVPLNKEKKVKNDEIRNEEGSNELKVTDLTGKSNLTFDKIQTRFAFAVNNIVGIEIDKTSNFAIVKFDSAEGMHFYYCYYLRYSDYRSVIF
jgi:hypothetical protein